MYYTCYRCRTKKCINQKATLLADTLYAVCTCGYVLFFFTFLHISSFFSCRRGVVNGTKQTWYRDISLQEGWSTAAKPECDSTDPAKPAYRALRLGDAALNGLYRCLFVKYCDGEVAFFDMTGDVGDQKWQPTGMLEVLVRMTQSTCSTLLFGIFFLKKKVF